MQDLVTYAGATAKSTQQYVTYFEVYHGFSPFAFCFGVSVGGAIRSFFFLYVIIFTLFRHKFNLVSIIHFSLP